MNELFIAKAIKTHGDRYPYTNVVYLKAKIKVSITCSTHGDFKQTPNDHLSGKGCPLCARANTTESLKSSISQFKKSVVTTFGDVYDFKDSKYIDYQTPIEVVCLKCSRTIIGKPTNLLKRKNPCSCTVPCYGGFKKDLPGILYYVRIELHDRVAYKIGITNKSVPQRFSRELHNSDIILTIIKEWKHPVGEDAYNEESRIKKEFASYRYSGNPMLLYGNTELFHSDILGLDNQEVSYE